MFGDKTVLAGWLVDGSGAPAQEKVLITIEEGGYGRIQKASTAGTTPSGLVDLSEFTLVPGLMDAHVHLFMSGTVDPERRRQQLNEDFEGVRKIISRHLAQLLAHGILAVRDGGDRHGYTRRYKEFGIEKKHEAISLYVSGKAWHKPGRYGSFVGRALRRGSLAEGILRENRGIDQVKIIQSGLNSLEIFGKESLPQFSLKELHEAVNASSRLGLKTMVHANGKDPVRIALDAGCASIEHGFFMGEENLARMAEMQVFWVPTAYTMKAYGRHAGGKKRVRAIALKNLDHQLQQLMFARKLGVPVALGTDSGSLGVHHGSALAEELQLFLEAGFSIEEAIRCATCNNARLLGIDGKGLIMTGMDADFVAVKGPPSALPESLKDMLKIHVGERFL